MGGSSPRAWLTHRFDRLLGSPSPASLAACVLEQQRRSDSRRRGDRRDLRIRRRGRWRSRRRRRTPRPTPRPATTAVEAWPSASLDSISTVEAAAGEGVRRRPRRGDDRSRGLEPSAHLYVDPVNGLDTNPGTLALPLKTIAKAAATPEPDGWRALTIVSATDGHLRLHQPDDLLGHVRHPDVRARIGSRQGHPAGRQRQRAALLPVAAAVVQTSRSRARPTASGATTAPSRLRGSRSTACSGRR